MPEEQLVLYRRNCQIIVNWYWPVFEQWSEAKICSLWLWFFAKLYVRAQSRSFCFTIFISLLICFFSEVKCPGLFRLLFCKHLKPALSLKGVITVSPHSLNPCSHAALSLVLAQVLVWPYGASDGGTDSMYYYCF